MWRFCAGTYFILLINACKQMPNGRARMQGVRSGLSIPEMLYDLAKIINPNTGEFDNGKTLRENATYFRSCKNWGGTFFDLQNPIAVHDFDDCIKSEYQEPLAQMSAFVDKFIDTNTVQRKDIDLVKALLELLDADNNIPDTAQFFVQEDGLPLTKEEILASKAFCLESFLLGMWHYAITAVPDNTVGAATYNEWCPASVTKGARRRYTADIGGQSSRAITLTHTSVRMSATNQGPVCSVPADTDELDAVPATESVPETTDAADSEPEDKPLAAAEPRTIVEPQTAYPGIVYHIGHVETLNENSVHTTYNGMAADPATIRSGARQTSGGSVPDYTPLIRWDRSFDPRYFNLIVQINEQFSLGMRNKAYLFKDRALTEFRSDELHSLSLHGLTAENRRFLTSMPAIFASENSEFGHAAPDQKALIGRIIDIRELEDKVKIIYEAFEAVPQQALIDIAEDLSLRYYDFNRSRWTVVKQNLLVELEEAGLIPANQEP